jgi:hypothetical protein
MNKPGDVLRCRRCKLVQFRGHQAKCTAKAAQLVVSRVRQAQTAEEVTRKRRRNC